MHDHILDGSSKGVGMGKGNHWRAARRWAGALLIGALGLGWSTGVIAQPDPPTTRFYTCAQYNDIMAGQPAPFGPSNTLVSSTGGSVTLGMDARLITAPGDLFTFTLTPGLVEGGDTPTATFIEWSLATFDPALQDDPSQLPPTTTVATGGLLGSTLTYAPTTTGQIGLVGIIDQSDGYGTLTVGCTHVDPSASATPTAVPTLSEMALGALALLMVMMAWRSSAPGNRG
ncbi:IPTL-CTERM sorting domain-containing protein [Ottowia sp. SB7-C50]|uniref:IPTL-CTERM sorting domain-containing protein n=1 Tax=Ottowia sp. SB7-C50 TaxID=3081231 RepID=UPI0029553270|nr:IPTL-CTERM sorting domain-containing protein [Ottowia sp. SB7-C50]WOP15479.1 IPTL-CTERM sorting domain-containing protein [Ottowia sp. SB7-C50]